MNTAHESLQSFGQLLVAFVHRLLARARVTDEIALKVHSGANGSIQSSSLEIGHSYQTFGTHLTLMELATFKSHKEVAALRRPQDKALMLDDPFAIRSCLS